MAVDPLVGIRELIFGELDPDVGTCGLIKSLRSALLAERQEHNHHLRQLEDILGIKDELEVFGGFLCGSVTWPQVLEAAARVAAEKKSAA